MPFDIEVLRDPLVAYGLLLAGLIIYRQPVIAWLMRPSRYEDLAAEQVRQLAENLREWRKTNGYLEGIESASRLSNEEQRRVLQKLESLVSVAEDSRATINRLSEAVARIEGRFK